MRTYIGATVLAGAMAAPAAFAVTAGQIDTFQGGTTMSWQEGGASPNPPTNVANSGPNGASDNALRNISSGGFGAGSKMIMFNQNQWTGNYLSEGITKITASMRATSNLSMRIGFRSGSTQYVSQATVVTSSSGWTDVEFVLANMVAVSGTATLDAVLSSVTEMRILHAASPSYNGGSIEATLYVDNIQAVVPAPSAAAIAIGTGVFGLRRRRRR